MNWSKLLSSSKGSFGRWTQLTQSHQLLACEGMSASVLKGTEQNTIKSITIPTCTVPSTCFIQYGPEIASPGFWSDSFPGKKNYNLVTFSQMLWLFNRTVFPSFSVTVISSFSVLSFLLWYSLVFEI